MEKNVHLATFHLWHLHCLLIYQPSFLLSGQGQPCPTQCPACTMATCLTSLNQVPWGQCPLLCAAQSNSPRVALQTLCFSVSFSLFSQVDRCRAGWLDPRQQSKPLRPQGTAPSTVLVMLPAVTPADPGGAHCPKCPSSLTSTVTSEEVHHVYEIPVRDSPFSTPLA